ncbi:MAG: right-handed parallel beta-helix repeat-containing protein [Bacteroidales bacterium]|nr:right-handed parallel beta-helix repeat-containing protein [Bacteroidales bacterium]
MKNLSGCIIWSLFIFNCLNIHAQTIIPGGYVSGNWDISGSPYLIDGNLLVQPDSALEIGLGTEILFRGTFRLEVLGQLLVSGTPTQPVIFDGENDTIEWRGIYFNATDSSLTDSSILANGSINNSLGGSGLTLNNSNRVRISGFTIRNCASFQGGAIRCVDSAPVFENLLIENNSALDGAGIALDASNAIIKNCSFNNNIANGAGGGMVIYNGSAPVLENCTFTGNSSIGSGGGIYINDASPVLSQCIFLANAGALGGSSLYSGGAVSVKLGADPRFENCTFSENTSNTSGGAIASFSPNEIINCLFVENSAPVSGGAIFLSSGNPIETTLFNNTFHNNESPDGSVLYAHNHVAVMLNCIAWQDETPDTSSLVRLDAIMSLVALFIAYSDLKDAQEGIELTGNAGYSWGTGNIVLDPLFLPGIYDLDWQSPCIEAGTPDTTGLGLPELDLNNNPRYANDRIDMGAFEYQLPLAVQSLKFKDQREMRVFPNPAREWVWVETNEDREYCSIELINGSGLILSKKNLNPGEEMARIDLSPYPAGIYLVRLSANGEGVSNRSIIKVR